MLQGFEGLKVGMPQPELNREYHYYSLLNYEAAFYESIRSGRGFLIDTEVDYNEALEKGRVLSTSDPIYMLNSIYSNKFQIKHNESLSIPLRYSCDCGSTKGKLYQNQICPECNGVVKKRKDSVLTEGWIELPVKVFTPIALLELKRALPAKIFNKIVGIRNVVKPKKGRKKLTLKQNLEEIERKTKKTPRIIPAIKIHELANSKEKFTEFLDTYSSKDKILEKNFLLANYENIFTSKINVISTMLRPQRVIVENSVPVMAVHEISANYVTLSTIVNDANKEGELSSRERTKYAKVIQKIMYDIDQLIAIDVGGGKKKHARSNICGVRTPYTGRLVIVPYLEARKINEVSVPEKLYRKVYKDEIKEFLQKKDWSKLDIFRFLKKEKLSPNEIELLRSIQKDLKMHILINRNPTIAASSMLSTEITEINDLMVLKIPLVILGAMQADFDGDVLNLLKIAKEYEREMNDKFSPYSFITTWDRKLNGQIGLLKDLKAIFCYSMSIHEADEVITGNTEGVML
jgi:DNA-directed RNA polymerase beta' subunit